MSNFLLQCSGKANNTNRQYDGDNTCNDRTIRRSGHTFPFLEDDSPRVRDQDDKGHVQNPRAGTVSKSAFAHTVEKELEIPRRSPQCTQQNILTQRSRCFSIIGKSFVLCQQVKAPYDIGGKASPQDNDVGNIILVEKLAIIWIRSFPKRIGHICHWLSSFNTIIETRA